MSAHVQNTPATPGRHYRWRRVLDLALLAGSAAATLLALTVVVALLWWLSMPLAEKPIVAAPPVPVPTLQPVTEPAPRPEVAAAGPPTVAFFPKRHPANNPVQQDAVAATRMTEMERPRAYNRRGDGDAERNRAIAQGLQQLARDPEAARELGIADQGATQ
jgi:hypothetical protein